MIRPENPEYAASSERLRIAYPEELPITRHLDEIRRLWQEHPLIIVGGDTGSGKTTQLPKVALELGWGRFGRIGCTQPRRIAASAMARRAAQELGCEPGTAVGYQVRFDDRTSRGTVLKFMTDGILLAETHEDRKLRQYSALIIDEAHERSLNIDFLLGYIKNLLPLRPDLKVAISSATLDTEEFSRFFGNAPVVSIEGRTYPVEDCFLAPEGGRGTFRLGGPRGGVRLGARSARRHSGLSARRAGDPRRDRSAQRPEAAAHRSAAAVRPALRRRTAAGVPPRASAPDHPVDQRGGNQRDDSAHPLRDRLGAGADQAVQPAHPRSKSFRWRPSARRARASGAAAADGSPTASACTSTARTISPARRPTPTRKSSGPVWPE